MRFTRYAVYYLPPEGSALARFGAAWLGWDNAAGRRVPHPDIGLDGGLAIADITATPRKYGFHGTMKPPFRLTDGKSADALADALGAVAARHAAFEAPTLTLAALGAFLALVPSAPSGPLADLAGACVQELDDFRAPPNEAELAKRRASGLSLPQEALLTRWGYPYVLDQFRFHLTLTGKLPTDQVAAAQSALHPVTAPLCTQPMPVHEIALLGEADGGEFHLIQRYPLTGSTG